MEISLLRGEWGCDILVDNSIRNFESSLHTIPYAVTIYHLYTLFTYIAGIFPKKFYHLSSVAKTQSSIEFQNSIFYLFHLNNSYFPAVVEILSLIHYP